MDSLFERVGFVSDYREDFERFYRKYFDTEDKMYHFFIQVFLNDDLDKTPRKILNQIERLVSLANDIELIRPARDSLRILFLQICIDAIYKLSGNNEGKRKEEEKKYFFRDYIDDEGKQYILENFVFSQIELVHKEEDQSQKLLDKYDNYSLTMDDFGTIIYTMRGMVAHEGDYWSMQFFSRDINSTWIVSIKTAEKMLKCYKPQKGEYVTYHFETTLNYERFISYFVKGCINFLQEYIKYKSALMKYV